jgi:hypothetical protein
MTNVAASQPVETLGQVVATAVAETPASMDLTAFFAEGAKPRRQIEFRSAGSMTDRHSGYVRIDGCLEAGG